MTLGDARQGDDPSEAVLDRDAALAMLAALPPHRRAVLALRYLEDRSDADIAEIMGCSRQAVASAAYRGLGALRASDAARALAV